MTLEMASPAHPDPLQRALQLAHQALWLTSPNPRVAASLPSQMARSRAEGHTQRAGGPHAEIMALRDAAQRGHSVQGATAWVTLEPCAHQGRTGPCCDALAAAGIARVVTGHVRPQSASRRARLAAFGRGRCADRNLDPGHPSAIQARELNIGFMSRWSVAALDPDESGNFPRRASALENGQSQWITSPEARTDGHVGVPGRVPS